MYFADDATVIRLITNNVEAAYKDKVADLLHGATTITFFSVLCRSIEELMIDPLDYATVCVLT